MARAATSASQRALNRHDQIALLLIRHLGVEGALKTCDEHHWLAIRKAVEKQRQHALDEERARRRPH
jgi:hypothetical protein